VAQVILAAAASTSPSLAGTLFAVVVLGAGWAAGRAMQLHRRRSAALTTAVAREQQRADDAAQEERARIARELHDIVAHAVSVMVIQAGAASEVMATDPAAARTALDSVRGSGQQALEELRRLLGVLRSGQEPGELAPQPGLDRLPALAEQITGPTFTVGLRECGTRPTLPASLELAVFRIVQEALTNTLKHGGPRATAQVGLHYGDDAVELSVRDDGRGTAAGDDGRGHGLLGMRERVAVYGGSVRAGPRAGGGFEVIARLPMNEAGARTSGASG
jgi:signal transduction histidine kinase